MLAKHDTKVGGELEGNEIKVASLFMWVFILFLLFVKGLLKVLSTVSNRAKVIGFC